MTATATKLESSTSAGASRRYKRLAVLDRASDAAPWNLLVIRFDGSGAGGSGVALEQATTFEPTDSTGLAAALRRARADRVVRVIPIGQSTCRPVAQPAPAGDPGQVGAALDLIAEAQLGNAIPSHRRGAGELACGAVVAASWSGNGVLLPAGKVPGLEQTLWVPPIAALSALADHASADLAVATQRATGAIAIIAGGTATGGKPVARITRDDGEDATEWARAVGDALDAACANPGARPIADLGPGDVSAPQCVRLLSSKGVRPRISVTGAPSTEQAWLDRYGLMLGAVLAAADDAPARRALLTMSPEPVVPPEPVLVAWASALARPARAIPLLAACVAVIIGWPLLAAKIRYERLSAVAKAEQATESAERTARQQAEFYQMLRDKRWPMTKLMADLTASLPAGITLETVSLDQGTNAQNSGIRVSGTSETSQAITDWVSALRQSKIFDALSTPNQETSGNAFKFELRARIAQPLTLGGKAIATPMPLKPAGTAAQGQPATGTSTAPANTAAPADDRGSTGRPSRRGSGTTSGASSEPPAPLTEAEIAAMDRPTAMREWTQRKAFISKNPTLDEETKKRLQDEAEKCKTRMDSLRDSGGGS